MNRCVIFILGIILASASDVEEFRSNDVLKISIFFSSLCPGSREFITKHLYPNYEGLKERILIEWVLYQEETEYDNLKFHCINGPKECEYNRNIVCALNQGKGQDRDVKFINCVMQKYDFESCLETLGYKWSHFKRCIDQKGLSILSFHMNKIKKIKLRRLTFIPAVIYNDNDNENIDYLSLNKFLETICEKLMPPLPGICRKKKQRKERIITGLENI